MMVDGFGIIGAGHSWHRARLPCSYVASAAITINVLALGVIIGRMRLEFDSAKAIPMIMFCVIRHKTPWPLCLIGALIPCAYHHHSIDRLRVILHVNKPKRAPMDKNRECSPTVKEKVSGRPWRLSVFAFIVAVWQHSSMGIAGHQTESGCDWCFGAIVLAILLSDSKPVMVQKARACPGPRC